MKNERPDWLRADLTKVIDPDAAAAHALAAQQDAAQAAGIPGPGTCWSPQQAGIVGAGTMGGGIAMAFANIGVPVTLVDRSQDALQRGISRIRANYEHSVKRGRLTKGEAEQRIALIHGVTSYSALRTADVVIEAVYEDQSLKREVFSALDAHADAGALLGTNTSGLDIDAIAGATDRPERVIGTHFFSPANVMRLLEIIPGTRTSPETLTKVMRLGALLGKVPVKAGNQPGFIGNAMLADYMRETNFLVEEGSFPKDVDRVLESFGFAMGVFRVGDMAGLDIAVDARRAAIATRPKDRRYSDLQLLAVDMGRLGQKTGAGWYRYDAGSRAPLTDPEMERAIVEYSARLGIERRRISDDEILARCLYALVNRAAWLLSQGVASRPSDIDAVYVTGYGFPATAGGPMYWADQVGLTGVAADIRRLHELNGVWWEPAPLLLELARTGRTFNDLDAVQGESR